MLRPRYKTLTEAVADYNDKVSSLGGIVLTETKKSKKITRKHIDNSVVRIQAEAAPLSMYSAHDAVVRSFRILAGIEEQTLMPRDPGLVGTTKFNESYDNLIKNK